MYTGSPQLFFSRLIKKSISKKFKKYLFCIEMKSIATNSKKTSPTVVKNYVGTVNSIWNFKNYVAEFKCTK